MQINEELAYPQANGTRPIRVMFIMGNPLDYESLTRLFNDADRFQVLLATADIDFGFASCQRLCPQVVIVDPKAGKNAVSRTVESTIGRFATRAILLDDRVRDGIINAILRFDKVSYISRESGGALLRQALVQIATSDKRYFDLAIADQITRNRHGWRMHHPPGKRPSVVALTSRELEVLTLLAEGNSVRGCANQLHLSESTVDNHKSRMMRKLDIHKSTDLVRLAIRDGLITV